MVSKKSQKSVQELFEELRPHKQSLPLQWDDDISLKIMELEPLMMFFRENFGIPTKEQVNIQIQQIISTAKRITEHSNNFESKKYYIHYEERFHSIPQEFRLTSPEILSGCPLKFQKNINLGMKYLCYKDGLARDIVSVFYDDFPQYIPIQYKGENYWQSKEWTEEDWVKIIKDLEEDEINEIENSDNIENLAFKEPNYEKYGDWDYTKLFFYFDKEFRFYLSFTYYNTKDESYLSVFAPISRKKIGEFYYFCEKLEEDLRIFINFPEYQDF